MYSSEELQDQFLDDIVEISPLIEDYLAAQLYELEVEYAEDISDETKFNLVLRMVLGELSTIGIEIYGGTDIFNDTEKIELIKVLRKEFDIWNLRTTLMSSEDFRNSVESSSRDWDEENIVHVISSIARDIFPLSTTWEYINNMALEHVASTNNLHQHVMRLIESIESGVISNNEEDELISEYTKQISFQRVRFIQHIEALRRDLLDFQDIDNYKVNMVLDDALMTYDIDLINNLQPDQISIYLDDADPHPAYRSDGKPDVRIVEHHKKLHTHHAECLLLKNLLTGDFNSDVPYVALLVADGHREPWTIEKNIQTFREYTKDLKLSAVLNATADRWMKLITKL